jgi:glycosyltransferase involved in cell wall biosynthesis
MRVALFLPSLAGGGAERVTVNLALGLLARGIEVDLVLVEKSGPFLAVLPPGVTVFDLRAKRVVRSVGPLARYLRARQPTALISAMDHCNLVALWAARRAGVKTRVITVVHTTMSRTISNPGVWTDRFVLPPLIRRFYRDAHAVVAVSHGAAADLRAFLGNRAEVRVITNPVITPDLLERAQAEPPHPWLMDAGPPVFLGVGRLWHQKNFSLLLRAFALCDLRQRARLLILGEGSLRGALEQEQHALGLGDTVAFPGFTANPYPAMQRAHAFVLSSVFEALPTVLIEALALGTRVIATDCPSGPAEILEHGQWGTLVPLDDADALSHAMARTLDTMAPPPIPPAALARYGVDAAVDQYLALL